MFRFILLAALAIAAATACAPLSAGPLVRVDVVDRDAAQTLPRYRHRGEDWIAGEPGAPYAVRLTNNTAERVLVVLSVDGVNAVTGQTADPSQAGYVLAPWQTTEVTGWRKSLEGVARFVFTDLPDSYAARTGRPDNVGVIGIAAFRERRAVRRPPHPPGTGRRCRAGPGARRRGGDGRARPRPPGAADRHRARQPRGVARRPHQLRARQQPSGAGHGTAL